MAERIMVGAIELLAVHFALSSVDKIDIREYNRPSSVVFRFTYTYLIYSIIGFIAYGLLCKGYIALKNILI